MLAIRLCRAAAFVCAGALLAVSHPTDTAAGPNLDIYAASSRITIEAGLKYYSNQIRSGASYQYWSIAAHLRRAEALHRLTRDPAFTELLVAQGEVLKGLTSAALGNEDRVRGRVVEAWVSTKYSCGIPYAQMVHAAVMLEPVLYGVDQVLRSTSSTPALVTRAKALANFAETSLSVFGGMYREKGALGYYVNSPLEKQFSSCSKFSNAGKPMAMNMSASMGLAHLWMYRISDKLGMASAAARHKTMAVKISAYFKSRAYTINDRGRTASAWKYVDGGRPEDASHAAASVFFALEARKLGLGPTNTDMLRLSNTFLFLFMDGKKVRTHLDKEYGAITGAEAHRKTLYNYAGLCAANKTVLSMLSGWHSGGFYGDPLGEALFLLAVKECGGDVEKHARLL